MKLFNNFCAVRCLRIMYLVFKVKALQNSKALLSYIFKQFIHFKPKLKTKLLSLK